jgi:hypothetical protein
MSKPIHKIFRRGCGIFLVAGSLFVLTPFAVYGQDSEYRQLEEKVSSLEKMIEELGDANAMLLENLTACTEEIRYLVYMLENSVKKQDPEKLKVYLTTTNIGIS